MSRTPQLLPLPPYVPTVDDFTPASGLPGILAQLSPADAEEITRWAARAERERWARACEKMAHDLDARAHASDDGRRDRFSAQLFRLFARKMMGLVYVESRNSKGT